MIVFFLGVFCGLISFILFVNMQLMKKISRRMERINTYIQMQASFLIILASVFVVLV